MMRPRESVFTAVVKKRRLKGASATGARTLRWNGADSVKPVWPAFVRKTSAQSVINNASPAIRYFTFLIILFLPRQENLFLAVRLKSIRHFVQQSQGVVSRDTRA